MIKAHEARELAKENSKSYPAVLIEIEEQIREEAIKGEDRVTCVVPSLTQVERNAITEVLTAAGYDTYWINVPMDFPTGKTVHKITIQWT
jgi:hypothetical protein